MTKQLSFEFYQVTDCNFAEILEKANSLPGGSERTLTVSEKVIRLQSLSKSDECWEGDLVRIRMDGIPSKVSVDGTREAIDLDDDQGIGEEAAFLYDPATNTVVIQHNKMVSRAAFCRYFESVGDIEGVIVLTTIINPDVAARFGALESATKFEISLAGFDASKYVSQVASTGVVLDAMAYFHAPSAQITMSMGHQKGSLSLQRVKEGINRILGLDGGEKFTVNKICVSGESDETDSKEVVDLIRDRMVERRQVEQDSNRTLPYDTRREHLRACWTNRKPELSTMFSNEG